MNILTEPALCSSSAETRANNPSQRDSFLDSQSLTVPSAKGSIQSRSVPLDNNFMAHTRLNEKVENPNHLINFITALPGPGPSQSEAERLLRALAAQLKPVMKVSLIEAMHSFRMLNQHQNSVAWVHCEQFGGGVPNI